LEDAATSQTHWDNNFHTRWSAVLETVATRISNPEEDVEPAIDQLDRLAREMLNHDQLGEENWPLYGALISSTRNISELIDQVSTATLFRLHSPPFMDILAAPTCNVTNFAWDEVLGKLGDAVFKAQQFVCHNGR